MASEYVKDPEAFHLYTADEYVDLVIDYIEHLRPDIVLERFCFPITQRIVDSS